MASITQADIRRFIIDQFVGEPHLLPHPVDRFLHAGMIHMDWKRTMQSHAPADSRINKALRDLTAEGWLEEAMDPDFGRVHGYRMNRDRILQAMVERQP